MLGLPPKRETVLVLPSERETVLVLRSERGNCNSAARYSLDRYRPALPLPQPRPGSLRWISVLLPWAVRGLTVRALSVLRR